MSLQYFKATVTISSMTPFNLAHSLLSLRGLVEREEETNEILKSIDSFSIQVRTCEKHLSQVEAEVLELRSQNKKMKNKTRRLENQLCKCTQAKDTLAQELEKTQDIHRNKIHKITHANFSQNQDCWQERKMVKERKVSKCSSGSQCQILTQSTILQLQEKSQILLRRIEDIQLKYQDQCKETHARETQIEELLLDLERRGQQDEQEGEKENDNSTLDNDSEKGSDFALPEWLETVQSQPESESMEIDQEEEAGESKALPQKGWLGNLSVKLCSFIFG